MVSRSSGQSVRRSTTSASHAPLRQLVRRRERGPRHRAVGEHRQVAPVAAHGRLADRHLVLGAERHLLAQVGAEEAVEPLGSRKSTGLSSRRAASIRPLASAGVDGATIFQPGVRRNHISGHWLWNGPAAEQPVRRAGGAAIGEAHDHRHGPAPAPVQLGGVVDQRVEAARQEVGELHLDDRAHPVDRRADRAADDRRLGERRVHAAQVAEGLGQAARDAEGAAVPAAHVLAEHEDALVGRHRLAERLAHRLVVGHACACAARPPAAAARARPAARTRDRGSRPRSATPRPSARAPASATAASASSRSAASCRSLATPIDTSRSA